MCLVRHPRISPKPLETVHTQPNSQVLSNISASLTHPPAPKIDKLFIASSSLTKGIDYERFNTCLKFESCPSLANATARIQKWPGGRARHIKDYIVPHLAEEKPTAVLVQAGGNDLAEMNKTPGSTSINSIANDIVEIGIRAKTSGTNDIFIGSVPARSRQYDDEQLNELNYALRTLCRRHEFVFIDNKDITVRHLLDGVHLNKEGTSILANNYLDALRDYYGWLVPNTPNTR